MNSKKDFVAEAIADYEAMSAREQGIMVVQILEDQPVLMGFITNLADDFEDSQHAALVDATVILINAFISKGLVVEMVPQEILDEVINEKVAAYEGVEEKAEDEKELTDSPIVFEDLRNYALFKSNLAEKELETRRNFGMVLDTVISIVERSIAIEMQKKNE